MKNLIRIIRISLMLFFISIMISNIALGFNYSNFKPDQSNTENIASVGSSIIATVRIIGQILSVGVLMVLGIKYMMGSAEEKAEYKKTMIPYAVGAVLIFAATFIVSAIYNFANQSAS